MSYSLSGNVPDITVYDSTILNNQDIAGTLSTNTINEHTTDNGVNIDGINVKDGKIICGSTKQSTSSSVDGLHIQSLTDAILWLESDYNNSDENDNPQCIFTQDNGNIMSTLTLSGASSNDTELKLYKNSTSPSFKIYTGGQITPNGTGILPTISVEATERFNITESGIHNMLTNIASTSTTTGTLVITGGCGISGTLYPGSIILPSIGGTASSLAYYGEETHNTTWAGIWSSVQTGNILVTRVGRLVTLQIPNVRSTANTVASITISTVLPARFRPSIEINNSLPVEDNMIDAIGTMQVKTDGTINIFKGLGPLGNFLGMGSSGFYANTITYSV